MESKGGEKLNECIKYANLDGVKECIANGANISYMASVNIEYIIESKLCVVLPLWYGILSLHPSHYSCQCFGSITGWMVCPSQGMLGRLSSNGEVFD